LKILAMVVVAIATSLMMVHVVQAEPYFAVQQGLKCMTCHVNPAGGGLRTAFGNAWVQGGLAARLIDVGEPWTGQVGRFVALGADLRAAARYLDVPNQEPENQIDVDEARLYLELSAIPERLSLYLDQRLAPGDSDNLEAYGRLWWGNRAWYLQGGQMYLPYGLRLEDDTAFIRQVPGINFSTPDRGLQLGYESAFLSAQLAVSNGTAGGAESDKGKQWSLRAEHVRGSWRVGASLNVNDSAAGDRRMQNLFAGLRTGPIMWLAEADYVVDDIAQGERSQWVGLFEANWNFLRGHNLKVTTEFLDPNDDVDEDEQARYGVVWEYVPIQFLQLRVGARRYDGIPQSDLQNRRIAFAELHGFF
jgi:hypothetical protein